MIFLWRFTACQRQPDGKGGAQALARGLGVYPPTMRLGKLFDQSQAYAQSVMVALRMAFDLSEHGEDFLDEFARDADSGVLDIDTCVVSLSGQRYGDCTTGGCELDGIA